MRVLVIGGGGREHALVWAIRRSTMVRSREDVVCVPGNAGIARDAICLETPSGLSDPRALADLADARRADLTVVGPELPLMAGLADEMERRGRPVFGATRAASRLEWSKVFAKEFMRRHGIPTAPFEVVETPEQARDHLASRQVTFPVVIKADGLASGKGVVIARDRDAAEEAACGMLAGSLGEAGRRVLIEQHLQGIEASVFALSDGERVLPMESCQDYKRAYDGDQGPNTGGMGAICPSTEVDAALRDEILDRIIRPAVKGLREEGSPYKGVLYAGIMLVPRGGRAGATASSDDVTPMTLEFNARFGDPETQVLLPRVADDLVELFAEVAAGSLSPGRTSVASVPGASACVVLAARGYPGTPETGQVISGLDAAGFPEGTVVFHAGTRSVDGRVVTSGGRVLAVSALGSDLAEARGRAEAGASRISFEGMHRRRDIGCDALDRLARRRGILTNRGNA